MQNGDTKSIAILHPIFSSVLSLLFVGLEVHGLLSDIYQRSGL
jgi:hypothetical protein